MARLYSIFCKTCVLFGMVLIMPINVSYGASTSEDGNTEPSVASAFPKKVYKIFEWPSTETMTGSKRVYLDKDRYIIKAKRSSLGWIRKTVKKDWLPVDPNYLSENLIMIRDEHGPVDVTHVRWEVNEVRIEVSQTMSVFALKAAPLRAPNIGDTTDAKKSFSREKCMQILNQYAEVEIVGPSVSRIEKRNVLPILLGASFERGKIQVFADGVHGTCRGPDPTDKEDIADFNHWWRRVNWWTDGKSVGMYTLKTEGGAWSANYHSKFDETWFEGSPCKNKRTKSESD